MTTNTDKLAAHMALTDEECDAIVARVMDEVAKAKGLEHAMHLNADITTQHTLRRAVVRASARALAAIPEPTMTLDGLTPAQFALRELYEFQEATGCDTAQQFKDMRWDVLRDRMLAAAPTAQEASKPVQAEAPSETFPPPATVNRYCRAGMCVETDAKHESYCYRQAAQGEAK